MRTVSINLAHKKPISVYEHFTASASLYREWSAVGHLHFGYYALGACPLKRHAMLEKMIEHTTANLQMAPDKCYADLGCGYGASAMYCAAKTGALVDGFTVIPEQVFEGTIAKKSAGLDKLVRLHERDFRYTEMPAETYDGAYAMESICYGTATSKADVLREVHRILKPGATLSLVDGFVIEQPRTGSIRERLLKRVAAGWAVDQFAQRDAFIEAMKKVGFTNIKIEDLSMNVAPSAMHAPFLIVRSVLKRLVTLQGMRKEERAHLASCFWGLILGMHRSTFRYLKITGKKESIVG